MLRTIKFNLEALKFCIHNGSSETDNNHEIDVYYHIVVEMFQPTYEEQIKLFCELLFEDKTELEYLVILYKCIEKYEPCIPIYISIIDRFEDKRSACRISFILHPNKQYLGRSMFRVISLEDLQYILSLNLDDDLLLKFLVEVVKGQCGENKKFSQVLVENVKPRLINKLFTKRPSIFNYGYSDFERYPILRQIVQDYPNILSNEAFRIALNIIDQQRGSIGSNAKSRFVNILESEDVCIRDVELANEFIVCSISETSHLIKLFKDNSNRSEIISLLLRSEKFDDVRTLVDFLEEESNLLD